MVVLALSTEPQLFPGICGMCGGRCWRRTRSWPGRDWRRWRCSSSRSRTTPKSCERTRFRRLKKWVALKLPRYAWACSSNSVGLAVKYVCNCFHLYGGHWREMLLMIWVGFVFPKFRLFSPLRAMSSCGLETVHFRRHVLHFSIVEYKILFLQSLYGV